MGKLVDFSTPMSELLSQGGGLINPGLYRVDISDFRLYDFNKPGNDSIVLFQQLQPVDADGNDEGDAVERRWPTNDKTREGVVLLVAKSPIKGRKGSWSQLEFGEGNTHNTIPRNSGFATYLDHCEKAEVDMDAVGNDITSFEGNIYEFGLYNVPEKAKTAVEEAEGSGGERRYPKQEVVIVGVPKKGKKGAAKKAKPADDGEEERPAKKSAKKGKETPESLLTDFLSAEVCTDENEDGADHMSYKIQVGKWLTKEKDAEPEVVRSVVKLYNDTEDALPAALATLGWNYNKKSKSIVKDED